MELDAEMLSCRREHITRRAQVLLVFLSFEGLRRAASLTRGLRTWEVYRALATGIVTSCVWQRGQHGVDFIDSPPLPLFKYGSAHVRNTGITVESWVDLQ